MCGIIKNPPTHTNFRQILSSERNCTTSNEPSLLALRLLCVEHGNLYDNGRVVSFWVSEPFHSLPPSANSDIFKLLLVICLMKIFKLPLESHTAAAESVRHHRVGCDAFSVNCTTRLLLLITKKTERDERTTTIVNSSRDSSDTFNSL